VKAYRDEARRIRHDVLGQLKVQPALTVVITGIYDEAGCWRSKPSPLRDRRRHCICNRMHPRVNQPQP
jgi:hypothetical protein